MPVLAHDMALFLACHYQVGCTSLSVGHPLLSHRYFDVCIADEAGQMTVPATLGPLLRARSFVLVGDPQQLPPLVISAEARAGGLGHTLFARLAEANPQARRSMSYLPLLAVDSAVRAAMYARRDDQ